MNLVGKIFTVLIFVMCLVFASFALMLHAAHKNWFNVSTSYYAQVTQLTAEKSKLQQAYDLLDNQRKNDNLRHENEKKDLLAANDELAKKRQDAEAKCRLEEEEWRKADAALKVAQQNLADLRDENEAVRREAAVASANQQKVFNDLVNATNEVNTLTAEVAQLQRQLRDLVEPYNRLKELLAYFGIHESDIIKDPPRGLTGLVTGVQASEVEISLGSDDGIHEDQRFAVTRPSTGNYVGDIVVYKVPYPNRAVCRADKPTMRDQIQKYDNVKAILSKQANLTKHR